jgi:hypothetical protein
MMPLATWLVHGGSQVVKVLQHMEKAAGGKKLTGFTFKCVEALVVPADFQQLTSEMLDESKKATASRLRNISRRLLRSRWWEWVLLNPNVPIESIHQSRSMHPLPLGWLQGCCFSVRGIIQGSSAVFTCRMLCSHGFPSAYPLFCFSGHSSVAGKPVPRLSAFHPAYPFCCITGTLTEVPAIEAMLHKPEDIRVSTGRWVWSDTEPFPPAHMIKSLPIFTEVNYQNVRDRLCRPMVQPTVTVGGQYVTVDVHDLSHLKTSAAVEGYPAPPPTTLLPGGARAGAESSSDQAAAGKKKGDVVEGLIHVVQMRPNSPVPQELQGLDYRLVLVELSGDNQSVRSNPLVVKAMQAGADCLVVGEMLAVREWMNELESMSTTNWQRYAFNIHEPESGGGGGEYLFSNVSVLLVRKWRISDFKVSPASCPAEATVHQCTSFSCIVSHCISTKLHLDWLEQALI